MIRRSISILFLIVLCISCKENKENQKNQEDLPIHFSVNLLKELPEAITNSAVSEGFIDNNPYVYTFAGMDSTKKFTGIHLRSYRFDVNINNWERIADVPDTLGKIASAASRIKDTIYIIGGYHVFEDGHERSSNKVHRFGIKENRFLTDGEKIPVPIDDQVQAVWRDSLIYVITGWSDKENVADVQIYNPSKNSWFQGTAVPNDHTYKSFGASGTIVGDTIFYFGGASMGTHYPIQNVLRKGIIDPKNPAKIEWSFAIFDPDIVGYRMASTRVKNIPHWLGGSTITYNYEPIAYNGSGGVQPANRDLYFEKGELKVEFRNKLPMDLRGIGEINDSTKIIVGGIEEDQKVSRNTYLLKWQKK